VQLDPTVAAGPFTEQVRELLARHFNSINSLDYDGWLATVTPERARDETREAWDRGYRSSHDSGITITALDPAGPAAVLVHLSFVSTQSPQDGPPDLQVGRICWTQQVPVSGLDGSDPRLGISAKGSSTRTAC
jgi:hypothetical protein